MIQHQPGEPVDILLVEDNPGDVRLTEEAFKEGQINNTMHVVSDGEEALDFLHRRGAYTDAVRPDIVLLDLNLPKIDGLEVLEEIRDDPELTTLPVIILTGSSAEEDVFKGYELHTNAYLTKPPNPDEFIELAKKFEEFWFTLVKLPSEEN